MVKEKFNNSINGNFNSNPNEIEKSNYAKYIIINFNHSQKDSINL